MRRSRWSGHRLWLLLVIAVSAAALAHRVLHEPSILVTDGDRGGRARFDTAAIPDNLPAVLALPPTTPIDTSLERPLFNQDRRPFPIRPSPKPAEQVDLALPPQEYLLRGAILTSHSRLAVFERRDTREVVQVKEGQEIKGWTVHRIDQDRVILTNSGKTIEMTLARPIDDGAVSRK